MRILFPLIGLMGSLLACPATAASVELIEGLNRGILWAEFRGAGDRAVSGTVGRVNDVPVEVTVTAGTQFWAQAGGRQGQATIGSHQIDLQNVKVAQVALHTCCTNLGLPEAAPADVMIPVACPSAVMARLLSLPGIEQQPHMAVQAAVWVVANDPRPTEVRRVLRHEPQVGSQAFATEMIVAAGELLRQADLQPTRYRLFR